MEHDHTAQSVIAGNAAAAVAAVEGAGIAHAAGKRVLYDCGGNYPEVARLLAVADILIPSEEFALAETGCKTAADAAKLLFDSYQPAVVVISQGKGGGMLFDGTIPTA